MYKDTRSDIWISILKPIVKVWQFFHIKTKVTTDVDFNRTEPYLLMANHVYFYDVIQLAMRFNIHPAIITSELLLSTPGLKWVLNKVVGVIPKAKGQSDVRTTKTILKALKEGYPIMVMPEGDTTFFGETGYIEPSTAKLAKKLGVDVIIANFHGGFLSRPRWAKEKRRNRYIELEYKTVIKKEDLPNLSVEEIKEIIETALYVNEYDWQREVMHPYPSRGNAEGLENVLYQCPVCGHFHSIQTSGSTISCDRCETVGSIDEYGFIHGFGVDTLIEWDKYQKPNRSVLKNMTFTSTAELIYVDNKTFTRTKPELVDVAFHEGELHIKGKEMQIIPISELVTPILTMRRNLSFQYEGTDYILKLESYAMSFLRVVQDKY